MRLPHIFVHAPLEQRITKHDGATYLFWTFVDLDRPPIPTFVRHEQRHVQQSVAITLLWLGLVWALPLSRWWLLTALVAWPLVYGVVSVVWKLRTGMGYTDNFFERDARRYAERG